MMTTEKKIGRPTVWHEASTSGRTSPSTGSAPKWFLRVCITFSAMTILAHPPARPIEIDDWPAT